jgi:hypothetical protein
MMHHQGVVVTIQEMPSRRPQREFDHSRTGNNSTATVVMPFGTEYALAFKIPDGKRRRLELTIDGTLITDSLIVTDGATLERFVDSAKRFKFVAANDPGVVDPTSKDNGSIVVKLWEEKPAVNIVDPNLYGHSQKLWDNTPGRWDRWELTCSSHTSSSALRGMSFDSHCGVPISNCVNTEIANFSLKADRGATVEGSGSSQKFSSTVWQGDCGAPLIFVFQLRGRVGAQVEDSGRPSACPCCRKRVPGGARYCPSCGVEVAVALTR